MRLPHLAAAIAALVVSTGPAMAHESEPHVNRAQDPRSSSSWKNGIQRTDLVKRDLGDAVHEVIQSRVDFASGVESPNHSHPGAEVAYVIEGTFEYRLKGQAPVVLKAGDSLYIPAGTPHIAKNVGSGSASELATYIVRKGEQLLVLED